MMILNSKEIDAWLFEHAQVQGHVCVSEKDANGRNILWVDKATNEGIAVIYEDHEELSQLRTRNAELEAENARLKEDKTIPEDRFDHVDVDADFKWISIFSREELSAFYLSRLPKIKEAARSCGYAIGVHGSLKRDFDLIAVPWIENPKTKDELAKAVHRAACGLHNVEFKWEQKPCGRVATSMPICWIEFEHSKDELSLGHIDLSVVDNSPDKLRAAELDNKRLREALDKWSEWLASQVQVGQESFDLPPEPISKFDYELSLLVSEMTQMLQSPPDLTEVEAMVKDVERYRAVTGPKCRDLAVCEINEEDGEWYALNTKVMADSHIDVAIDAAKGQS